MLIQSYTVFAQNSWTSGNVFGADCFIENKGQFDQMIPEVEGIEYAYIHGNQEIYLTEEGFTLLLSKIELEEKYKSLSPNGDLNNDVFKPIFNCETIIDKYEFTIYNRWGQQVFATNDQTVGWDGIFQGEEQLASTYFYLVKYRLAGRDRERELRGDITLIR